MNIQIKKFFICTIVALIIGCTNGTKEQLKYGILAGAESQHRTAVALVGLRYVGLIELLQANQEEKVKEELDWFIDTIIMEIAYSEKNAEPIPKYVLEELTHIIEDANLGKPITPPEFGLRKLAEYRKNNPRIHKIKLSKESIILIDKFINKYTGPKVKSIVDKYLELLKRSITNQ